MNRAVFLIFVLLSLSCNRSAKDSISKNTSFQDSIVHYYDIAIDENNSLNKRREAINKSLSFSNEKDTFFSKVLYQKNFLHFTLKQYDSLLLYSNLLLKQANHNRNEIYLGKQHHLLAYYFDDISHNPDSAFYHYNLSRGYFLKINDSSNVGRRLISMGLIQQNHNDYFGSKETLTEALQYLRPKKDTKYITSTYSGLATNHRKLFNHTDAIDYYKKAISISRTENQKLGYLNNLAATYIDEKLYDNSIILLEEILKDSTLVNRLNQKARVLDNLAYANWLSGKNKMETEFKAALGIRIKNNDKRGLIASYTHLGEYYTQISPKRAASYFDSVIQLSKILKIPKAEKDAFKFLMELKPKNVNLRNRYVFLQDSLYAQELKVKTQFAKYKYDDKLKQESILRLEKENAEKELEASRQRNQKIMYLGSFLFITTVFGLSLYGFRQRTNRLKQKGKAETLEAINETEAELSRKLHDDYGGKLNQAMLLVQRDADKSAILDNLEALYNQIRDFSREINSVDTGPNYWKVLKATLEYAKAPKVEMTLDGGKELDWSLVGHQTKTILFKVLQELVINMARHSNASQTIVLFRDQNKKLLIYYEDDGVGASKESLLRKNGLRNTEKRIQSIGGTITFDSEEEKGFRVEMQIPK